MPSKRTYRTTLVDGTVPDTEGMAICVHCDGRWETCENPCDCECHKHKKKDTCLCREGILQCCDGCGCLCHDADWKEYNAQWKKKQKAEDRATEALEKKRFANEGVREWEKLAFIAVRRGETSFARDYMLKKFIETTPWEKKEIKPAETGDQFMSRMKATPWGKSQADRYNGL